MVYLLRILNVQLNMDSPRACWMITLPTWALWKMCSTLVLAPKGLVLQTDSARTQGGEPIVALAAPLPLSDASRMACAVAVPRTAGQSSKEIAVLASVAPVLAASVRESTWIAAVWTGSVTIRLFQIASDCFKQVQLDSLQRTEDAHNAIFGLQASYVAQSKSQTVKFKQVKN